MISVVMVQYNLPALTFQAVESIKHHNPGQYEIIIVDNGSSVTNTQTRRLPDDVQWVQSTHNTGFGSACNLGASRGSGDILLFLNNDIICTQEIIAPLKRYFDGHQRCGAVGLGLETREGTSQISIGRFPTIVQEWKSKRGISPYALDTAQPVDWVTGAALAVRTSLFRVFNGFDQQYFMYFEDIDLCRRIWQEGFEVHFVPAIRLVHLGGGSQPDGMPPDVRMEYRKSQLRYYRKHNSMLQCGLLRIYLVMKFGIRLLVGDSRERHVAAGVLREVLG
jgi:GT2 family glycosyltransferase